MHGDERQRRGWAQMVWKWSWPRSLRARLSRQARLRAADARAAPLARVRGVVRVEHAEDGPRLHVDDGTGRVRVAIDDALEAYGADGPRRALRDGDQVDVLGPVEEEAGAPDGYRTRSGGAVFARGTTIAIRLPRE